MSVRISIFWSILVSCLLLSVSSFFGQTRKPAAGDIKVTYRTSMVSGGTAARESESTTMIKGPRERSEQRLGYGYDTITITQCDLKRTIQISDTAKKYLITQIETGEASSTPTPSSTPAAAGGPTRRGGVVTYTTSTIDTGERKEMFGFTARHVKSATTIQSSPDACSKLNQRIELDGWYIDLNVGFDCQLGRPPVPPRSTPGRTECQDQTRFRREGSGRIGFPLVETMRMVGDNGQVIFSSTKEVIELSRTPLDSALFDVPAGYTQVASQQELYTAPSMADVMAGRTPETGAAPSTSPTSSEAKKPASFRVGVAQFNNKAGKPVAVDSLRARLMGQLQNAGYEPIALNGSSQMEADAEAKAKQCDFILLTDIVTLKSSKLGGVFGRVTGVDSGGKTEAKVEFKLYAVGETTPRLQSSATAKEEGDEASAGTAVENEARMVISEVRKKGRG